MRPDDILTPEEMAALHKRYIIVREFPKSWDWAPVRVAIIDREHPEAGAAVGEARRFMGDAKKGIPPDPFNAKLGFRLALKRAVETPLARVGTYTPPPLKASVNWHELYDGGAS